MPSFIERIEYAFGRVLFSVRGHDAKLFIKAPVFKDHPEPKFPVTSPECGESELQVHHTPMGENRFPELKWDPPASAEEIIEYLLVVEDPDAPLPMPVVHGIYYAIPATKTLLQPKDFESISEGKNALRGGFKFGGNRMKSIWGGPKPVLGHGSHRYMFQVVALKSSIDEKALSEIPTRAELEKLVDGKVIGWGMWTGTYERRMV